MEGILGSKNFEKFYYCLATKKPMGIREYFDVIQNAMFSIADDVHIGMAMLIVNSPANSFQLAQMQDRSVIFKREEEYNLECGIRKTFVTQDWGVVQLEIYSTKDYKWNAEEESEVEFLIQILFDSISRIRFAILLNQAQLTDPMTGACNSSGIIAYANDLYKDSKLDNYCAVFFGVKNYNYLSQKAGYKQGEKVLKSFIRNLRDYLVKGETIARMGGDLFAVLIEKERTEEFIKFVNSQRVVMEKDDKLLEFDVMVKFGVYSICPVDSGVQALECAKTAYSYTKNPSAGDVVYFKDEMLTHSAHDEQVCGEFANALKKREFAIYYQPKVDLANNELVSAEALCRWIKDGNVIPPMDFIPALENEGIIGQLDFYMLNLVCEHIHEWIDRGIEPVRISVNFSRANILNAKLAEKILKVIASHKVENKYLEVEITEMSGYEDFESLSEFVDIMKRNGIETSIDDFGTGYSSLNLIKDLNVDTIKLDKSFLEKINKESGEQDKSVVKNIISMVNELNMKVVAEGVETGAQMEFLKQAKCQTAQGYLFDKPLPKEKFEFRLIGERFYS